MSTSGMFRQCNQGLLRSTGLLYPAPPPHTNLLTAAAGLPLLLSPRFFPLTLSHQDLCFPSPVLCGLISRADPGQQPAACELLRRGKPPPPPSFIMTRSLISRGKSCAQPGFTSPADVMLSRCGPADCLPSELAQSSLLLRRQKDGMIKTESSGVHLWSPGLL